MAPRTSLASTSAIEKARNVTAEELYLLPKYPFYELYDGVLQVREPSGSESANVATELTITLGIYVRAHHLGKLFGADHGCVIKRDPDTVLTPDVSFIRHARIVYGKTWEKFFEGVPGLAVEVMSPSDTLAVLQRKAERYRSAGTPLVWVIQPRKRVALIYRQDGTTTLIPSDGILDGEDVIPGFTCQLASLFS